MEEPKERTPGQKAMVKWRKNHREQWNEYQREYAKYKFHNDPDWKDRHNKNHKEYVERQLIKDPDHFKKIYKRYHENNKEAIRIRSLKHRYFKKLYETRNDFDDDDDWYNNALCGCKSDVVIKEVLDGIDGYMERREKREAKEN